MALQPLQAALKAMKGPWTFPLRTALAQEVPWARVRLGDGVQQALLCCRVCVAMLFFPTGL